MYPARRVRPTLVLALLVTLGVLVMNACSGGGGGSGSGEQAQEEAKAPTIPEAGEALPAGKYVTEGFQPTLSFTVGKGWQVLVPDEPPSFTIFHPDGNFYIAFWNVQRVYDPKRPTSLETLPAPEDMAAWLHKHPSVKAEEPQKVSVGGISGVQFDAVAARVPQQYPEEQCAVPCVPLFDLGQEERFRVFPLLKDAKMRFVVVDDVEGETVTIVVGASEESFEDAIPKAQEVIDTVEWKGA